MYEHYESFSEKQLKIINRYVTDPISNVFALKNLPEVIKGALFSRYSRSSLGFRSLLLKEFISNEDLAFADIVGSSDGEEFNGKDLSTAAIRKAQNFYDRILDGYGDDSIGELGGAHLACENVSMLAAKAIEDCRIGGSPLEKSTRYVYFDQKFQGQYFFYREPILMTSAYKDLYISTCNQLFDTYVKLIPPLMEVIEKKNPKDPAVSSVVYTASLRAKVLDCLRGLLPSSTLTNMGVYGNGRFFESLLQKLQGSNLAELQDVGKKGYGALSCVIPSFVRRAELSNKYFKTWVFYNEQVQKNIKNIAHHHENLLSKKESSSSRVRLIHYDSDSPYRVAAALLFNQTSSGLLELQEYCRKLPEEELNRIFEAVSEFRENRRHKSPRALEHATFTFEIVADFGIYRDLQRHRTLTQERQILTCNLGFYIPEDVKGTWMQVEYEKAIDEAKVAYDHIAQELPEEAQYIVPMAYNVRFYFHVNLRALQWLCELRSSPAGHPGYRLIAQEMAKAVSNREPYFERFFKFVDYEGYGLGRLGQEIRSDQKREQKSIL
jgi:thymidylate synthase ThyX